jgi:hypothetical protein
MRKNIAWIAVLLLAFAPAAFAAKGEKGDKGPSAAQIAKANERATFDKDNMCAHTNAKGKKATFCPADIGHLNDEERGKGCIIGKLDTERNTEDGLTPGQYHVYMRREGSKWQIFYVQKDQVIAQAKSVKQNMDNEHKPSFVEAGTRIRYWELQFSF